MIQHKVGTQEEWEAASRELLAEEKAWTRERDRLAEKRKALPWVKVEKDYVFDGPDGRVSLSDLFDGRSQLFVYHFMFAPDWEEGCGGCSFIADHVDGARQHFEHNDLSFAAISRAPVEKIEAYRKRMGWTFPWVSSGGNDFNYDFHASFTPEEREAGTATWNLTKKGDPGTSDIPGVSTFYKDAEGAIYHSYSTFARGGEMLLGTYAFLDMAPLGRNEGERIMGWMKRHDRYPDDGRTRHRQAEAA